MASDKPRGCRRTGRIGCLLTVLGSLAMAVGFAWFTALWPQTVTFELAGPPGAVVVRVGQRSLSEPLPTTITFRNLAARNDVRVDYAGRSLLGEVQGLMYGFKSGHVALACQAEGLDGSAWFIADWSKVEVRPPEPGQSWLIYDGQGAGPISVDGVAYEDAGPAPAVIPLKEGPVEIRGRYFVCEMRVDPGACVCLSAFEHWGDTFWLRSRGLGFSEGWIRVDGKEPVVLGALTELAEVTGRECEIECRSITGRVARIHSRYLPGATGGLLFRLARDP